MLVRLKAILNSYTDKELEDLGFWVNGSECIEQIIVENNAIDLISENAEVKINDFIDKEAK